MRKIATIVFLLTGTLAGISQEFMKRLEDNEVPTVLNNPTVIALTSGEQLVGTLSNLYLLKGKLIDISIELTDKSKRKLKAKEIDNVKIRIAKPTMFSLRDDNGEVVKKIVYSQIVFDHPYRTETKVKPEMMQVLNPGFDTKIKVFADLNSGVAPSVLIKGEQLGTPNINAFIVSKGVETYNVNERSYGKEFSLLFGDCGMLADKVTADQMIIDAFPLHLLVYDYNCSK